MMNHGAYPASNNASSSFNLSEIWPFPINGVGGSGGESAGCLDMMRRGQYGESFGNISGNGDVSGNDPVVSEHRKSTGGSKKKWREEDESGQGVSTSSANGMSDCDGKRIKMKGTRDENQESKAGEEANSGKAAEPNSKPAEPPKQDYIHVRARRGQATDSHSLAERARREKISERMKILQDLVPGCNKVIGKALVLDEIINYIQSLQRQVEFLSMKLEAVNRRMNPRIEVFPSKDLAQETFDMVSLPFGSQATRDDTASLQFGSQATREYGRDSSPEWLHMQVGGGFEKTT